MDNTVFQNEQIEPEWLPRLEDLQFTPLPISYRNVMLIAAGIFFAILLAGIFTVHFLIDPEDGFPLAWILLGWFALTALVIGRIVIVFPYKGYAIRHRDIIYKKGWLWRSVTTVPFNRVQHCDIKQGPIERQFNLSSLNVYTAGGQNSDLTIPGLEYQMAEKYKAFILKTISSDEEE
jgi:membrane protein YdbS with pleckstrin-like domain